MTIKNSNNYNDEPSDDILGGAGSKKKSDSGLDSLISSMRPDMPLASDIEPAKKNIFEKINTKLVFGILMGIFIVSFFAYLLAGPGRPLLEQNLSAIILHSTGTATALPSPPQASITATQPQLIILTSPSPTVRPTSTPTFAPSATPTILHVEATATSSSACRDALTITLADVGQTLCVEGTILQTFDRPNGFMVVFSNKPGAFYWVSYDMVWSQAELEKCYKVTGKIERIGNSPILLFNYQNIPEVCP